MWISGLLHILLIYSVQQPALHLIQNLQQWLIALEPQTCFEPLDLEAIRDEVVVCNWGHPGQFPPRQSTLSKGRCCFNEPYTSGIFWAIGENTMSHVLSVDPVSYPGEIIPDRHPDSRLLRFDMRAAVLVDIRAVDDITDEPIEGARVTMANDAMHLVSYAKWTDSDGYAVMPMIPGETYVITVRADRYLTPAPFDLSIPPLQNKSHKPSQTPEDMLTADLDTDDDVDPNADTEDLPVIERIVTLDPGICISGTVFSPEGKYLMDAEIHAEITRPDGSIYQSDIDHPVPMSALATRDRVWIPEYSSNSTDYHGQFELCTLPRGEVRLYATHQDYPPSGWITADARELDQPLPIKIHMSKGHQARIRVEDKGGRAISTTLKIYDAATFALIAELDTPESGSIPLTALPDQVRFVVVSTDGISTEYQRTIADDDEIVLTADDTYHHYTFHTFASSGSTLKDTEHASIHILDASLQKSYPDCMGETDETGEVTLEFCPDSFWTVIAHPDYGNHYVHISREEKKYTVDLNAGETFQIEFTDGEKAVDAECTVIRKLKAGGNEDVEWPEYHRSQNGQLILKNMDSGQFMECTHGSDTASAMLQDASKGHVSNDAVYRDHNHLVLSFPQRATRNLIILDAYSSPIPYARFIMDGKTYETDADGRYINLHGIPGHEIVIYHYQHGRTKVSFETGTSDYEIHLPDIPDPEMISCLQSHQIQFIEDSASVLIDMSIDRMQIIRGDYLESCDANGLGIVRDGRRIWVKW